MPKCEPFPSNEYEQAYVDHYCSFNDVWGPYIWMGLALLAIIVLGVALSRRQRDAPKLKEAPLRPPERIDEARPENVNLYIAAGLLCVLAVVVVVIIAQNT